MATIFANTAGAVRRATTVRILSLALVLVAVIAGGVAGLTINHGAPANAATSPAVFSPIQGKASIGDTGQITISGSASIGDTGAIAATR